MVGNLDGLSPSIAESLERIARIDFLAASDRNIQPRDVDTLVGAIGITRIAWTTQLDRLGTPTLYCVRPAALHPCAIYSSGKAFDARRALLSGVFECYERWAAEQPAFCLEASANDLAESSQGCRLTVYEPPGFDSASRIRWALGRSLGSDEFAAIPACYVEFPPGAAAGQSSTTTGLAAHADYAEACKNALLECVERHYTAALTVSKMARVAAEDFSEQASRLAEAFAREDIELHAFVIDPDARLKTAYCYAYDHWLGTPRIQCSGFGASTSPRAAVDKAILEIVQSRAAMISGLRDDVSEFFTHWRDNYRENTEHLAWLEQIRSVERVCDVGTGDSEPAAALPELLATLAADDLTPLIFPLRRAAGFPAVRALIPQLNDSS